MAAALPPPPPGTDPLFAKWVYLLWQPVLAALTELPTIYHPGLSELNSASYYHLTQAEYTAVVYTTDGRLVDARPASDVYAWAKASVKPTYTWTEVGAAQSSHTHNYAGAATVGGPADNVAGGTAGQLLYQSAAGITAKLALGAANSVLGVTAAGTGLEYKGLAAGSNITITHTAGTITIASAAGGGGTAFALTMNNGGTGDISGTTFDGTVARTLSFNTLGAVGTSDARLSDARIASDVYAWAKAAVKPTYTYTEVGAQIAGSYPTGSGTCSGTNTGDQTTVSGSSGFSLQIPVSSTTGTAVAADRGKCISLTAGITIPASVFTAGDAVSLYNNTAAAITITQGAGLTLRKAATATTGNLSLAQRNIATLWFLSATEAIMTGAV